MLWLEAKSDQEKLVRSGFAQQPQGFQAFDKDLYCDQGVPDIRSEDQDLHGNQWGSKQPTRILDWLSSYKHNSPTADAFLSVFVFNHAMA
jgi:hypothetical protein